MAMYTQHSEGGDDLFVCDVCEAILVSEQEAETSQTSEDSGYEGGAEGARAPKIDMTFVERQFYVCRHCDDIFLDKNHLHVHINISHDLSEKENHIPVSSTTDTPPQSPKPKRFKKRVPEAEDDSMIAREVSRIGISQTQTPANIMAPPPPVISTLLTTSSAKRAGSLPDDVNKEMDDSLSIDNTAISNDELPEKKNNEATSQGADNTNDVRISKDNSGKETISNNLVTANDKHPEGRKKNKATILKELNTNRRTRSCRKATPRYSMEVEVNEVDVDPNVSPALDDAQQVRGDNTNEEFKKDSRKSVGSKQRRSKELATQEHAIETDVGCKSSPSKGPITEENDVNEQVEDTETIDVPIQYKLGESIGRKPRRSKELSSQQTPPSPCVGVGKFYGSTLSSTSPKPAKENKSEPSPMKVSKSLHMKRKLKSPLATDKEVEPCAIKKSKSLKVNPEVAMEYQCPTCGDCKDKKDNFKNHFLSHYYHVFNSVLPSSPPYTCPECKSLSRDKITLLRHYAWTHKKMYTMTDVTEDKLKEIMAKALVPKE